MLNERIESIINDFVDSLKVQAETYIQEYESNYFGFDYIDALEENFQDVTEDQFSEIVATTKERIQETLKDEYEIYIGYPEYMIPINGEVRTIQNQLVLVIPSYSKSELIEKMDQGFEITLEGNFSDGETEWNYEYWKLENEKYRCSYDGESSQYFDKKDLNFSFCPEEAENISIGE